MEGALCKKCGQKIGNYKPRDPKNRGFCRRCGAWNRTKDYHAKKRLVYKLEAMQIVSRLQKPKCFCGCDDLRILQINHKNLGGREEARKTGWKGVGLYLAIIRGERKIEDLEILCSVCNAKHYAKKKYGLKFEVKFIT